MIWWHSKGYSWLVGLRVVRRVVTHVAIEVIQGCFRLCFIFDQVWQTRMWYWDTFIFIALVLCGMACGQQLNVAQRSCLCVRAKRNLPHLFFQIWNWSESFHVDAPCAH